MYLKVFLSHFWYLLKSLLSIFKYFSSLLKSLQIIFKSLSSLFQVYKVIMKSSSIFSTLCFASQDLKSLSLVEGTNTSRLEKTLVQTPSNMFLRSWKIFSCGTPWGIINFWGYNHYTVGKLTKVILLLKIREMTGGIFIKFWTFLDWFI